ncbi:drap deaminase [Pseudohyphozyma bogoriensis]|nr:drap deaminase [Pseudohyphozyma bogoriensis]
MDPDLPAPPSPSSSPPPPPAPTHQLSIEERAAAGRAKSALRPKQATPRSKLPPLTGAFAIPDPKPEYYEDDGLRKVKPYMYAFHSWAKERWQDRTLMDVYGEFSRLGQILVNQAKSTPDFVLKNGDLISNILHRHEPPVVAGPIKIIYDGRLPGNDGQTFVVEKPGSMPIHSTGRYHFNTLLSILKYDYDLPLVHTSNRLDRLTSGVMVCALTVEKSKNLGAWFGGRMKTGVHKEYVARCLGKFPDGEIVCEEPLLTIDRQLGVNVVHPDGRPSKTIFKRLSYHEGTNTSAIHCQPITGRSHQIRVHLQFLGYPIANDPVYQNQEAWGINGGKGGVFGADRGGTAETRAMRREIGDKMLIEARANGSLQEGQTEVPSSIYNKKGGMKVGFVSRDSVATIVEKAIAEGRDPAQSVLSDEAKGALEKLRVERDREDGWARERDTKGIKMARAKDEAVAQGEVVETEWGKETVVDEDGLGYCEECFTPMMKDPRPEQLFIWLHAMRYRTEEWDWSSEMPYWAQEEWDGK